MEQRNASGFLAVRLAGLTWAAAWPVITLLLAALSPLLGAWPLAARTLLLSGLMVMTMTYVVMPILTPHFSGWLRGERPARLAGDGKTSAFYRGRVAVRVATVQPHFAVPCREHSGRG